MQSKTVCLIIKLNEGKIWVAQTSNPRGYETSLRDKTCTNSYIKAYGFNAILETSHEPCQKIIIDLMHQYGMENVRGTFYPKEMLNSKQKEEIKLLLKERQTTASVLKEKEVQTEPPSSITTVANSYLNMNENIRKFLESVSRPEINKNTFVAAPNENPLATIFKCEKKMLYILKLKRGRYYVGTTTKKVEDRIREHKKGKGAWFTQAYKVEECIYNAPTITNFDEDNMTEALMFALGSDGVKLVRGGSYSELVLSNAQLETLQRKFDHLRNACLGCGEKGHYIIECPHPDGELCANCHCRGHNAVLCTNVYIKTGQRIF